MEFEKHVLIIGSGPNAVNAAELEIAFDAIVVINNAWRVRRDWSHLIYPYDFPKERWPQEIHRLQDSQSGGRKHQGEQATRGRRRGLLERGRQR